MAKTGIGIGWTPEPRKKNKGVHATSGTSRSPGSKNYKKKYRGQGRAR